MDISKALVAHLQNLTSDPDQAVQLASALRHLSDDIAGWVPSWQSASIVLAAQPRDIDVSILAPGLESGVAVTSSMAVRISDRHGGAQLIVRALRPGAFLLLGDDLSTRLGRGHLITLDRHLTLPPTVKEQAAALLDRGAVNQAIGVLLAEGFTPRAAHRELRRRAAAAASSLPAAAHRLLDSLNAPPDHEHVDTG